MEQRIIKVSEFFKITGSAPWDEGQNPSSYYFLESLCPVAHEVSAIWQPDNQAYTLSSYANSLDVQASDGSRSEFTGAQATAETHYDFIPLTDALTLKFTGQVDMHEFENSLTFKLIRVDGNLEVEGRIWKAEHVLNVDESIDCAGLVPGSIYRVLLAAKVLCGDTPGVTSRLKAEFV